MFDELRKLSPEEIESAFRKARPLVEQAEFPQLKKLTPEEINRAFAKAHPLA